ncbi:glycosyltransferase family 2 protein [Desulfobaculum sp. SPO524]|uniref:glycosyltransferase family 2 protein n=1 Tax=Desulfobaculum sp. SPO524 TaxID=3378071 RepID=UPI0038528EDC
MSPRISVIIPNHNYSRYLPELFASLRAQSVGLGDVEVLFVDDASTDDSVTVARRQGETLGALDFRLLRIARQGRPGPVRNVGLAAARGRYLLCMDSDDVLESRFLEATLAALKQDPRAGLAYTDLVRITPDGMHHVALPECTLDLLRQQNVVSSMVLLRREAYEACGGFRGDTLYEDWDMWLRIVAAGFTAPHVPEALYVYRVHADSFTSGAVMRDAQAKAAIVLANRQVFPATVAAWARGVMRGEAWAAPFGRGLIPRPEDVRRLRQIAQDVLRRRLEQKPKPESDHYPRMNNRGG